MQLIMSLPFSPSELQAARDAAGELLAKVNAIAQIVYGNHENLRIGAVGHKDPIKGSVQYFISGQDTIRVDARFGTGGIVTTSEGPTPPKKLGDQFISAADKDEHLERALYLYGSLPLDWRGLYMVLEAAEDKHGGEKGLYCEELGSRGADKGLQGYGKQL